MVLLTIDKKNKMCTFKTMIRQTNFKKKVNNYDKK